MVAEEEVGYNINMSITSSEITTNYPKKSVLSALLVNILYERKIYDRERVEKLKKFTGLALIEVDRHDADNYPGRNRRFIETVGIYHPEFDITNIQTSRVEVQAEMIDKQMNGWLSKNDVNIPGINDWFKTNLVWEHIMAGGKSSDIPEIWKKYLNVEIRGNTMGYPSDKSIWKWEQIEPEERIMAYRMVTNHYFAKAMCDCLGSKAVDQVAGIMTIYQLASDRYHQKNEDEPLISLVIKYIQQRTSYTDRDEAKHIAELTGVKQVVADIALIATKVLSRQSKTAEWDKPQPVL